MVSTSWTSTDTLATTGFDLRIIDSANGYGGLQQETTALGVPCLTLRKNTERPITVEQGANTMVGRDAEAIRRNADATLAVHGKDGRVPELWDGHTAQSIARDLAKCLLDQHQVKKSA